MTQPFDDLADFSQKKIENCSYVSLGLLERIYVHAAHRLVHLESRLLIVIDEGQKKKIAES